MNQKGGDREGTEHKLVPLTGKRINVYLDADLRVWYDGVPLREKSKFINQAIREKLAREALDQRKEGGDE